MLHILCETIKLAYFCTISIFVTEVSDITEELFKGTSKSAEELGAEWVFKKLKLIK
uniref:Uncharacterized protein n=1 Tax=Amphimedon queenslandica TaxID=400682 RepID=A0A1X7VHF1_AMPQE